MADYYPLIARAVSGLDNNTGDARRALYERARTALLAQLRGVDPGLSEADITRERLALEEAIRKVEGEAARRPRVDTPRTEPIPPPRSISPPPPPEPKPAASAPIPPERPRNEPPHLEPGRGEGSRHDPARTSVQGSGAGSLKHTPASPSEPAFPNFPSEPGVPADPMMPGRRAHKRPPDEHPSLMDQGLKGFREVMAESEDLGEAAASASKSARDAFAAFPPSRDADRAEPRFDPEEFLPTPRELPSSAPPQSYELRSGATSPPHEPRGAAMPRAAAAQAHSHEEPLDPRRGRGRQLVPAFAGMGRKLTIAGVVLALGIAAVVAYQKWPSIAGLYQSVRGPATQAAKDTTQTRPKIGDRIGSTAQDSSAGPAAGPAAAVAQRVVLYEQQPNSPDRKQYIGSVIWRSERAPPGPGLPPDIAIKADVEIPERHIRMSFTMRRNTDQTLPASHTIELLFSTPPDFPPGGIADVPGVLMEQAEQSRGVPLTGLRVKVTNGYFLIGLSALESDARRNNQLLKERSWLHLPIAYNNGNRALLAIEKGVPGDRIFSEAFAAWGQ